MGDSLTVERLTLDQVVGVRVPVPQPRVYSMRERPAEVSGRSLFVQGANPSQQRGSGGFRELVQDARSARKPKIARFPKIPGYIHAFQPAVLAVVAGLERVAPMNGAVIIDEAHISRLQDHAAQALVYRLDKRIQRLQRFRVEPI